MAVPPPVRLQLQVKVEGRRVPGLACPRVRKTGWGILNRGKEQIHRFQTQGPLVHFKGFSPSSTPNWCLLLLGNRRPSPFSGLVMPGTF